MARFLYVFLLTGLLCVSLKAHEIGALLTEYEKASELSKKTKDESAGHLVVFTADEIRRMQARTLKDLLKSQHFFAYLENRIGNPDLMGTDPILFGSNTIRVYLNEHELFSSLYGSGFGWFGDIELDFIDHVEIYNGFPTFDFGIEPAMMVIRLYTKEPSRENGGRIKAMGGSYGANAQSVYHAGSSDTLSYFAYAGRYDDLRDTYSNGENAISRDKRKQHFFAMLGTTDHHLQLHGMRQKADELLGPVATATPYRSESELDYFSAAWHSQFLDNTLFFNASFFQARTRMDYEDNGTLYFIPPATFINSMSQTLLEHGVTLTLNKKWEFAGNSVNVGIQWRGKKFEVEEMRFNGLPIPLSGDFKRQHMGSFFLQDMIALDENQMLTFSIMNQLTDSDGNVTEPHTIQMRAGYIYSDSTWVSKTFGSFQQFAPEPYHMTRSLGGNPTLKCSEYALFSNETSYRFGPNSLKTFLALAKVDGFPILNATGSQIVNSPHTINNTLASIEYTLAFREKDQLLLEAEVSRWESPYDRSRLNQQALMARLLNTVGGLDLFNEVIWRGNYRGGGGYDYSAGIRYSTPDDLTLFVKGENIFDNTVESRYFIFDPATGNITRTVDTPNIDRRFWIGMEYLF